MFNFYFFLSLVSDRLIPYLRNEGTFGGSPRPGAVSRLTRSLNSSRNTPAPVPKTDLVVDFISLQVLAVQFSGPPSVPVT